MQRLDPLSALYRMIDEIPSRL